jgi:hypothetical protein
VELVASGAVRKMKTRLDSPVRYTMLLGEHAVELNHYLGREVQLEYHGVINCIHCGRKTNKSFNQGYCYPCFQRLAQCDSCIVSPQKCHHAAGTCREPAWGEQHCMIPHIVYLANTSGLKVGITRESQLPTRWMDQGATQALPMFRVATRLHSGLVEVLFKTLVADKTNWQAMLKSSAESVELELARQQLTAQCAPQLDELRQQHGLQAITELQDQSEVRIDYPVLEYPAKVTALNLDKTPTIGGALLGIKAQYLIFNTGVINMRKYGGYQLSMRVNG